jgi:hypothetical protein
MRPRNAGVEQQMPPGWHPDPGSVMEELDAGDSVELRQRWHEALCEEGLLGDD